ncbi:MAG: aldo/keto reductase [Candidatus Brocadiia bacterium]
MEYRQAGNTQIQLSTLGFGCMRLPKLPDEKKKIDFDHSHRLFRRARELGVNYFDTAYMYDNGDSERCLGQFLQEVDREDVVISAKNPVGHQFWPIPGDKPTGQLYRRCLEEELERLGTDTIDFYLFHDSTLVAFRIVCKPPGGCLDQALRAREEGLVRHIGFSSHDSPENIKKIIDMADGQLDFMVVQYNLLNRKNEALIETAHELGMGVSIMGPVGGGRLVHPSQVYGQAIDASSTPEAAIRFVLANPHVTTAMSGMNSIEQVEENAAAASRPEPLSDQELEAIDRLQRENRELLDLYCTGCGYCMPCPNGVDIPGNFAAMNTLRVHGLVELARKMYRKLGEGDASHCVECGECAGKCPQDIDIQARIQEVAETFESAGS